MVKVPSISKQTPRKMGFFVITLFILFVVVVVAIVVKDAGGWRCI
jgi:hypothetical protein